MRFPVPGSRAGPGDEHKFRAGAGKALPAPKVRRSIFRARGDPRLETAMQQKYLDAYEFDDALERLDYAVLESWLSQAYWSLNIKAPEIERGARNSTLVVGCYRDGFQVGYMRLTSDKVRFGYIMDVYVEEKHRRKGIAENMVKFAMAHPDVADVYVWLLGTRDGHSVYRKAGFGPLPKPDFWMILRKEKDRPA
jgi:GNAT superfamily N-acetyltransferase